MTARKTRLTHAEVEFIDARKQKALRARLQAGIDSLERGDFIEFEDAELEGYLKRLMSIASRAVS